LTSNLNQTSALNSRRSVPLWAQICIWAVLAALLGLIAVALNHSQQGSLQRGQPVGDFSMPLFSGYQLDNQPQTQLSALRGRVVLVNFWASWCKPCEQEAGDLEQAWQYYQPGGQVVFLGVDYVDTEPQARAYLAKFNITFASGPDLGTRVSGLFHISGVPESYLIDQHGLLQYAQIGPFTSVDEIKARIDPLLQK
jgi:cytochrome c biogenesis protein CcmG, thiol:disulfide interchange protein DsbE